MLPEPPCGSAHGGGEEEEARCPRNVQKRENGSVWGFFRFTFYFFRESASTRKRAFSFPHSKGEHNSKNQIIYLSLYKEQNVILFESPENAAYVSQIGTNGGEIQGRAGGGGAFPLLTRIHSHAHATRALVSRTHTIQNVKCRRLKTSPQLTRFQSEQKRQQRNHVTTPNISRLNCYYYFHSNEFRFVNLKRCRNNRRIKWKLYFFIFFYFSVQI